MNLDLNKEYLDTAIYAAKTASDLIIKTSKREIKTFKAQTDLVTDTDLASEEVISTIIRSKYPDHSILAEESGMKSKLLIGEDIALKFISSPLKRFFGSAMGTAFIKALV